MGRIALAFVAAAGLNVVSAGIGSAADDRGVRVVRFLGEQRLPYGMEVKGTTLGGLSGIDRDPRTGTWYFISDDRWRYQPARFYTGRLDFNGVSGAFTGVSIDKVTTLSRADGSPYPAYGKADAADPESIRYDPVSRKILWAQEGDRPEEGRPDIPVSDLSVRWTGADGRYRGELQIPRNLRMTNENHGPRRDFGFEGLTFAPRSIAAIVEGPRFEDGPSPTTKHGAPARIMVWNRKGQPLAQYAYPIDPLPAAPIPPSGHTDSGVSEILAIDDHRYLALERSWIEGVNYRVKLYEIDLREATNILTRDSLMTRMFYRPVEKRLLLDLSTERRQPTQNLESLAWGPRLHTGEQVLVIGSDDNFSEGEATQFLAYALRGLPDGR
ncbi:esterase-like activity of phytase family protein [Acrocarpospora phusangensis]|nr:esterase-like activity of phytase family protein [Acrocarpospora phusangensis]